VRGCRDSTTAVSSVSTFPSGNTGKKCEAIGNRRAVLSWLIANLELAINRLVRAVAGGKRIMKQQLKTFARACTISAMARGT